MSLDDDTTETGGCGADRSGPWPTCTNCGRREARRAHTLRFARPDDERSTGVDAAAPGERRGSGSERVVDLQLCPECVEVLLAEPGVERVRVSRSDRE